VSSRCDRDTYDVFATPSPRVEEPAAARTPPSAGLHVLSKDHAWAA
jgi:hypothetical protein